MIFTLTKINKKFFIAVFLLFFFGQLFVVQSASAFICVYKATPGAQEESCKEVPATDRATAQAECKAKCPEPGGCTSFKLEEAANCEARASKKIPRIELINPIGVGIQPTLIYGLFVEKILGVIGSLALIVFIAGGFMWLTSAGNDEKVKNGSMAMLYAAIGLAIVFSSYAILNQIINTVTG